MSNVSNKIQEGFERKKLGTIYEDTGFFLRDDRLI